MIVGVIGLLISLLYPRQWRAAPAPSSMSDPSCVIASTTS